MNDVPISGGHFQFPAPKRHRIVETKFMLETINSTLGNHPGNTVWTGASRLGKTTTALHAVKLINDNYNASNPHAFRAVHFECGEIAKWAGHEQKKGIKALHNAVIGRIDEGMYRSDPIETLVETYIRGLQRKNIQIIFIDEAGNLSVDAIRGMMMCYDKARNLEHNLSLVFIGMDDLPIKIEHLPQISGRIHYWNYFNKFLLGDIADFLKELYPHLFVENISKSDSLELIEMIYELFDGFPGLIIPFLGRVEDYLKRHPQKLSVKALKMIHYQNNMNKQRAIQQSKNGYEDRDANKNKDKSENKGGKTGRGKTARKKR